MVKIKVMLPYYNDLTVLLSTVFRSLDFDIDYMGRPTKKTIELATNNSPEIWCFDTKLWLGQLLEGHKRGNDLLVMPGAWGGKNENCILGYLTKGVMKKRLESIVSKKINLWVFNINCIELFYSGYSSIIKDIKTLKPYYDKKGFYRKAIGGLHLGVKKMKLAHQFKEQMFTFFDVEDKKALFKIYDDFTEQMIFNADTITDARKICKTLLGKMNALKRKKTKKKIKIGVVGDFCYTLFSAFPIFNLEHFLIQQEILISQPVSFYNFFNVLSPLYSSKNRKEVRKIFPQGVTGSDAMTLLSSNYLKDKVDGIIHVGTFSCTHEEIAMEVLLSHKEMFPPMLNLSYDSHTTEENMKVRVEAFIDMIKSRRK